jgi:hypothetical protein
VAFGFWKKEKAALPVGLLPIAPYYNIKIFTAGLVYFLLYNGKSKALSVKSLNFANERYIFDHEW